jgi:hypothetical protein
LTAPVGLGQEGWVVARVRAQGGAMQYEIRAMGLAEILDMGFRLLRNHFALLLGIAAVIYLPLGFLTATFKQLFEAPPAGADLGMWIVAGYVLLFLVTATIVSPMVSCAITYAIGELYLGRPTSMAAAFGAALSQLLPMAGTYFLASIAIGVGLLLLVVPGLYLMLAFALLTQVIMLEGTAGMNALSRSRELMQGNLMRGAALLLVLSLLGGVLSIGLGLAFAALPALDFLGSALAQAVAFAYYSAVSVVFYFEIRARKEAFDLEHLARLVESGGAAAEPRE